MIRRRLLTGGVSNFAGRFATAGIWFVLTPFVLAHLEPSGYGLWVLMGAVAAYGLLLDFGIGEAVVKYVAEHLARGERQEAKGLITSARWLTLGLGLAAVGLALVTAALLPHLMSAPAGEQLTAIRLVLLTGVDVAIAIAFIPHVSVLRGLQRHDLYNGVNVVACLLQAAATVAVLLAGWGVVGMIAINIPITAMTCAAATILIRRIAPDLVPGWRGVNRDALRRIASFSTSGFAIDLAARLQSRSDEWVIALFRPISAVTPYALSRRLGELTALAAVQCLKVIMPLASELHAGQHGHKLRELYIIGSRVALGVAVPIAVVLVLLGGPLLALWVGPQYAEHGTLVAVLAIASLIATSQSPAGQILLGIAKHRIVAISSLASGAANIALSILLLPSFGLLGVAVGTLVPTAVTSLCVVMPFANRTLQVSWSTALRKIWIPGLVPGAGAAVVLLVLRSQSAAPSALALMSWATAAVLTYGIGYLCMPASAAERELLSDVLASVSQGVRDRRLAGPRRTG